MATATSTAPEPSTSGSPVAPVATSKAISAAPVLGNLARGKVLYATNCAACHGATGHEGGVGPSLRGEKGKMDDAAVVRWIKNPRPPMPKLYPAPLSAKDVSDVAAFVESL